MTSIDLLNNKVEMGKIMIISQEDLNKNEIYNKARRDSRDKSRFT